MKTKLLVVLTAILLSSCTSTVPVNPTKTINTNELMAPSSTPEPSSVDTKTPLSTTSSSPILLTPSPWPTVPVFITPDADQLARWQEYERVLAKCHLSFLPPEEVLCEWEILEQSEQNVYVWAVCSGTFPVGNTGYRPISSIPSVIHLGLDGAVQSAEIPGSGTAYARDIRNIFPAIAQERIFSRLIDFRRLSEHLETRLNNPEPPLIVLSAMSAPNPVLGTPLPTQLTIVPTLNPTQVIQQEEIKSVIQEYFGIHYQALSISPPEDFQETGFGDLVSELPEAKDFEEIEKAKLEVQAKYWEINHLRYAEYKYSLNYDGIVVDSATSIATVLLIDRAEVVREYLMEFNPDDPHITVREFRHRIVLQNERGEWKIVSDTYWDSWWQQFGKPGASKDEVLNAIHLAMQRLETMPSPTP